MKLAPYVLLVCCLFACQAAGHDPDDVEALRKQVETLREEVVALREALEAARPQPPSTAAPEPSVAPVVVQGDVRVHVTTQPPATEVLIADEKHSAPVDVRRPGSKDSVRVRITRAGYRTIEQRVVFDRDRELQYQLTPGRGLEQRPTDP